jgi:purine nucleoside permease
MRKTKKRVVMKKKVAAKAVRKVRKGVKLWTSKDVATLRKMYKSTPASKIAKVLKRTRASVQTKVRGLGLKKKVAKARTKSVRRVARRRR